MKLILSSLLVPALLLLASEQTPKVRRNDLKPLTADQAVTATHAPFASGDCSQCHRNSDPKNPGPVIAEGNALCLDCHDEFLPVMARKFTHAAASSLCVSCHNPHNSKETKLLVEYATTLCLSCHDKIKTLTIDSPVKHGALTQGAQCVGCHDPHAANVEHLLVQPLKPLCLSCHDQSSAVDRAGKKLTNMRKWLDENPRHHGPVEAGDCSACHNPHASRQTRLLIQEYTPELYAPYDPKVYALCFECHEESAFTEPETDKATLFRDGRRNLHYLHVNREGLGRTCRTCHEVHSSKREHQIREGVPYGASGWLLKLNYAKTPTGGTCVKTCHRAESYQNQDRQPGTKEP